MAAGDNAYWSDLANVLSPPLCKLVKQDAQSITSGAAAAALNFGAGSEEIKTLASMHSTSTNTSRIVVPVSGYYDVRTNMAWVFNTILQYSSTVITLNGNPVSYSGNWKYTTPLPNNVSAGGQFYADYLQAAAGDYFEMRVAMVTSSAAALTTNSAEVRARFSVKFDRPL